MPAYTGTDPYAYDERYREMDSKKPLGGKLPHMGAPVAKGDIDQKDDNGDQAELHWKIV